MKPMRVLYLEPSGLVTGGAIALLRLVEATNRRRFRLLVVLGSDGPLAVRFRKVPGCRVLVRPFPAGLGRITRFNVISGGIFQAGGWLRYGLMLRGIARRWKADVVHTNGLKMHLLSILVGRGATRLLVWHLRDLVAPPYMPRRTALILRWLIGRIPHLAICNSEATKRSVLGLTEAGVGAGGAEAAWRHVKVVPDGIAVDWLGEATAPRRGRRRGLRVVMLGRIARWKGQDVFVTAAARLCEHDPTTTFLVAGNATTEADAAFERDLRSQVDRAGLSDRIQFLGLVDDVPDLLRSVDLAVHCSTSPEPFGQVILEAMAASVPVVATALGGPAEIITNGVDGRLVPPGDDEALARVLAELLRHGALRRQLAARGLETVRNRFGIQQTARQVAAVYEEGAA